MDSADAIIANLTPYHGINADTGTCYELGYMCAQGKRAYGYTSVAAHAPRPSRSPTASVVDHRRRTAASVAPSGARHRGRRHGRSTTS